MKNRVNICDKKILRKLRQEKDEFKVTGLQYTKRLREQ